MIRANPLDEHVDRILVELDGDRWDDFEAVYRPIESALQRADPADVQAALARLVPVLATVGQWRGYNLAQAVAGMTMFGADPMVVLPTMVGRAARAMERADRFAELHRAAFGEPPDPTDGAQLQPTLERIRDVAADYGLNGQQVTALVSAWFIGDEWVQPVLYLNQRKDVRAALPQRERLLAAVERVPEHFGNARWLEGLLLVLDGEPLVVLDRSYAGTGRGYRVTVSGIGDNFQLHTLLAAALIGPETQGLLPGRPPSPEEVAAATDGPDLLPTGGIHGTWDLAGPDGQRTYNEGRPADIPHLDGVRLVVLDAPTLNRIWTAGRAYPGMVPELSLDSVLPAPEAAAWLARCADVAPPRRLTLRSRWLRP